jgi:phage gp36-like protein
VAYATIAEIQEIYGEQTLTTSFDRQSDGSVDPTAVTRALDAATSEIDSYLASLYDVPIDPVTDHIKQITVYIAIYRGSDQADVLTDEKRRRYEDAIKWLTKVAEGKIQLGGTTDEESKAGGVTTYTETRRFTRTNLDGL